MREKGIRFYASGGFTLEAPEAASGIPDDSYCINTLKSVPDIVIEVIITSGNLDKREIYRSHQVPEVWFWQRGNLVIYQLQAEHYQLVDRSQFFPELDPQQLVPYLKAADQYDAVSEFANRVRQGNL